MKKRVLKNVLWLLVTLACNQTIAQVKVGDNPTSINSSAIFEMESTNKGILFPRLSTAQRGTITSPATGLLIYNTTTSSIEVNTGTPSTPVWQALGSGLGNGAAAGNTPYWNGTNWVLNSINIFNNGGNVGIGTTAPASGLDIKTSMGLNVTTITSATTLNQTHNVVLCNTGPYTVTLPAAAANTGKVYYIKNIDSDGDDIIVDGNLTETIDGATVFLLDPYKHSVRIISDGTKWHVLEEAGQPTMGNNSFTQVNCNGTGFTWNNVTSSTGKVWMDRNLGASQVATSNTDANSYGDLYQWGRAKDGHQCRTGVTFTTTQSKDNFPPHRDFIAIDGNWRSPANTNLWQGVSGINNPCPNGYRLPTVAEFNAEIATWTSSSTMAYNSVLKLPNAGTLDSRNGGVLVTSRGYYYSSSSTGLIHLDGTWNGEISIWRPADGCSVRCIKN
jgi:uncharacterized protein (TIGR02145 family)